MRAGDVVTYVAPNGSQHLATVVAIVGTGPSLYKRLCLKADGAVWKDVPNEVDKDTNGYWRLGVPSEVVVGGGSVIEAVVESVPTRRRGR